MQHCVSIAQMTEDSKSENPRCERLKGPIKPQAETIQTISSAIWQIRSSLLSFDFCSGTESVVFEGQTHVNVLEGSQGIG